MNQSFIDALMHFFSLLLLPLPGKKISTIKLRLEEYIRQAGIGFPIDDCLRIYNTYSGKYFFEFSNNPFGKTEDIVKIHKHLILEAGNKAQENLLLQERLLVILSLLEFNMLYNEKEESIFLLIQILSKSLNISNEDFEASITFLYNKQIDETDFDIIFKQDEKEDTLEGEWIDENSSMLKEERTIINERVKGRIHFHLFKNYNYYAFIYTGDEVLFLNDSQVYQGFFYSFGRKNKLKFHGFDDILFEEIEDLFAPTEISHKIVLSAKNISYRYPKTNYSIKPFSFREDSGQLIAILGNNGTGKSTILKLISSQLELEKGNLFINGRDFISNSYKLRSIIAYVPQEEVLFSELTVYENLLFQANLCLGKLTRKEIELRVFEVIGKLQLEGIMHLKAGENLGHKINTFQKVCLKIAVELIRKPYIIFLDEPLSGLGFSNTKRLITILREEANQGRLIFLTSQIPTNEIFNSFDKVWLIDQDGYLVYNGDPSKALSFFRDTGLLPYYFIQSKKDELSAEDLIKIIESKKVLSDGSLSEKRQVSPGSWYDAWRAESEKNIGKIEESKKPFPLKLSPLPAIEKQFLVYLFRNFKLRFSNFRHSVLMLAGVPLLGVILALILRFLTEGEYYFGNNPHIPLFFFIASNILLLVGMLSGAEEMFEEKQHYKRDIMLNLSMFSYQNSKLIYLLLLSFIQAILFSLLSNLCLGLEGLSIKFTFIYFSLLVSGNLLGLIMSAGFRRMKTIYIIIPFLLILPLLFSGYLVDFKKSDFGSNKKNEIPLFAELIPSRWSYEALMVSQFSENPYNKYFFKDEKMIYDANFFINKIGPVLNEKLNNCNYYKYISPDRDSLESCLNLLKNEFSTFIIREDIAPFEKEAELNVESYDSLLYNEIFGYITYLSFLMESHLFESESNLRENREALADSLSPVSVADFKLNNHNRFVSVLVIGDNSEGKIFEYQESIRKEGANIYLYPEHNFGISQFFVSDKIFTNQLIPSYRFNLSAIWLINMLFYIVFLVNGVEVIIRLFRK